MFLGPKWERVGGEESGSQRTEASTLPRHRTEEGELLTGWVGVLLTAPGQGKGWNWEPVWQKLALPGGDVGV